MMKTYWNILKDDITSLVLVSLMMFTLTASVVVTGIAPGLTVLFPITGLALLAGYLLARSTFGPLFAGLTGFLYGLVGVWSLVGRQLPEVYGYIERLVIVTLRLSQWVQRSLSGGYSEDNLVFVALLGLLAWLLTLNLTWNLFREQRFWRGVLPPGLAMLINAYYYFGPIDIDIFIAVFVFLMLALIARTNGITREQTWRAENVGYSQLDRVRLTRGGIAMVALIVAGAWFAPAAPPNQTLASIWESSENPWMEVQDSFERMFGALEGQPVNTPVYYAGTTLSMGGPVNLGDSPVMTVYARSGHRYYWRSKLFEYYDGGSWITQPEAAVESDFGRLRREGPEATQMRETVQHEVEVMIPATRVLYAAPQPIGFASIPITYNVIFNQPDTDDFATITSVRSRTIFEQGDSYLATSSLSIADEVGLRSAGMNYPNWIRERYLQVPDSVTGRTRRLAHEIAAEHTNPYDAARAIETYLRTNITYNERIPAPPADVEPIDYVLFQSQEGYCVYYASAMTIMLRSIGIPARMAAGFAQGERDLELDAFVVRETDAHTWVEAYFPGYGWINFEPTSSRDPIVRQEDSSLELPAPVPPERDLPQFDDPTATPPAQPTPDPADREDPLAADPGPNRPRINLWALFRVVGVAVVLIGGAGGGIYYWLERRGLNRLSEVERRYALLNVLAPWVGVEVAPSDTPLERAAAYRETLPPSERPVREIVHLHMREQYSEGRLHALGINTTRRRAREAWSKVQGLLLRTAVIRWLGRFNPLNLRFKVDDVDDESVPPSLPF